MAIKRIYMAVALAIVLWFIMFSPWTAPHLNFWLSMSFSGSVLLVLCYFLGHDWKSELKLTPLGIAIGLGSAVVLWGVFYVGNYVSTTLFDFAKPQVGNIYGLRDGTNYFFIAVLLLCVVGPAETFFWQGLVQRNFMQKWGDWKGFLLTTLVYSIVHIWAFNVMLLLAATVCGLFWGFLYMYLKPRNLVPLIISHGVWDVMVFIIFPIT